jgi:hypothetical protein
MEEATERKEHRKQDAGWTQNLGTGERQKNSNNNEPHQQKETKHVTSKESDHLRHYRKETHEAQPTRKTDQRQDNREGVISGTDFPTHKGDDQGRQMMDGETE